MTSRSISLTSLVRTLEAVVGVELFHRSQAGPARLVLTEAAQAVLPELQAGFDHLTVAFERLKASRGQITISITVPPAFADKWLLPRVERFATHHPLYDLRIDTSGRLVDFAAERMDLGIRHGGGRWPGLLSLDPTATFGGGNLRADATLCEVLGTCPRYLCQMRHY